MTAVMEIFNVESRLRPALVLFLVVRASAGIQSMDGLSECEQYGDPCKCRLASNPEVGLDLTPIKSLFSSPNEGFAEERYVWGPCGDVLDYGGDCAPQRDGQSNPAACQGPRFGEPPNWNSLGTAWSATFDVEVQGDQVTTTLNYTGGTSGRSSTFILVCDEKSNSTFAFLDESPALHYNFIITSNAACLVPVYALAPSSSLSAGSIMLIVAVVLGTIYMLGGLLYNKVVRGATGVEVIPNRDSWMLLPDLILAGVTFALSPCQSAKFSGKKMQYERL